MSNIEYRVLPQKYDDLIKLSKYISSFKTPEMELVFAKVIQHYLSPTIICEYKDND